MARPEHAIADVDHAIAKAEHAAAKPGQGMQLLKEFWSELPGFSLHRIVHGDKVWSQMWYE